MTLNINARNHPSYHPLHVLPADLAGKAHTVQIRDVIEVEVYNKEARDTERKIALLLSGWAWYLIVNKTTNAFMCEQFSDMTHAWVGKEITLTAGRAPSKKPTILVSAPRPGAKVTTRWPAETGGEAVAVDKETGEVRLAPEAPAATAPEAPTVTTPSNGTGAPSSAGQSKATNGNGAARARVQSRAWAARVDQLARECPYYQNAQGKADPYHMTGAAAKCGFQTITDENLDEVITALVEYAKREAQEREAAEQSKLDAALVADAT